MGASLFIRSYFLVILMSVLFAQSSFANVLGDMQTFSSNTDGLDFITVHSARPLTKGYLGINSHITYAKNHLLVYRDPITAQDQVKYSDQLSDLDVSLAFGVTKSFQLFLVTNFMVWQESKRVETYKVNISEGMNVNRPGFKWTVSEESKIALIGSVDFMNVANDPYTGVDAKPIYNIELAKNFGGDSGVLHGFNLGYRFRNPTARPVDGRMFPLDDQLTASYGASSDWSDSTRWVFEVIGSLPIKKDPYIKTLDASSLDLLLALNHKISPRFFVNGGATVEPLVKSLAPQYRVFAGLTIYLNLLGSGDDSSTPAPAKAVEETTTSYKEEAYVQEEIRSNLRLNPGTSEVYEGARVQFKGAAGKTPYVYRIVSGEGEIDTRTGSFRAPFSEGTTIVEVEDRAGFTAQSTVYIKKAPKADKDIRLKNLQFKFDTDILTKPSQKEVDRIVTVLSDFKIRKIVVEGHTDSKGSDKYNLNLSQKRAERVRKILIKRLGLDGNQVEAIGFGEERPVTTNSTEKGRLLNRRVDLKIYFKK